MSRKSSTHLRKFVPSVRGFEAYESSVLPRRHKKLGRTSSPSKRGRITELSSRSLARLAFVAFNTLTHFASMMTLTYSRKFPGDGRDIKRHLDIFLKWYRRTYPGEFYLWWLEFQRRGAPHFHILSTVDLGSLGDLSTITRKGGQEWQTHYPAWKQMRESWANLGGGLTAWELINDQEGGKKYAAKYATKAYQKQVPEAFQNVGRFWGHSRNGVKPEPKGFYFCDEASLRQALEQGGWEHLPDDSEILYRELFQAAQSLDTSKFAQAPDQDAFESQLDNDDYVFAETGLKSSLILRSEHFESPQNCFSWSKGYLCSNCGQISLKWAGQCSGCNEWHTLEAISGRASAGN